MSDELAKEIADRYNDLTSDRKARFDVPYQYISNYFLPQLSNINTQKTEGITGWTERIYDTTAVQAAQVLRSGQRNWLTPSSEPWFTFEPPETLVDDQRDEAAQWLSRTTDIAIREIARSNFYSMVNLDYLSVGVFGTGLMFCEEGKKTSLNFRQFKVSTYVVQEDDEGVVDTVYRDFELTTRQAVQMFGVDKVGDKIKKAYETPKKMDQKWKIIHAVFPREDSKRIEGRMDGPNKPIASVYMVHDGQHIISVSGYDEMPYFCSRFDKWGTDSPYGYSPAFLCLPEVRELNYVTQYTDALAELMAYPRLLYPDNLEGNIDLRAGGVTTYDSTNPTAKPEEWMTKGNYMLAKDLMDGKKDAINKAFFVNMFTMLDNLADKKMTAYEIAQRLAEKLEMFTPVFDRRVTEFLNPLLKRIFGILFRAGKFGAPQDVPSGLLVVEGNKTRLAMPEIAITSRISLALKALQNQGMINTMSALMPLAEGKPEILDNFDTDAFARTLARNFGTPVEFEIPMKKVAALRAARVKAMQQQNMIAAAESVSKTAANVGQAPQQFQDAVMSNQ